MQPSPFAVRHPGDRWFWIVFLATCWFAIAMGFYPPIKLRFTGHADYPPPWILIVHVWSYFGWIALLTLQVALVESKRTAIHRKLGVLGAVLAVFVTVSGVSAEVFSQRFYAAQDPENIRFFMIPVAATIMFAAMAFPALVKRRDTPTHKRLIYLATTAVVAGPYARWWGHSIEQVMGTGFWGTIAKYYTGMELMLLAAVLYDLLTRGSVHRVFRWGVPFLLLVQVAGSAVWHSDWWPPAGRQLLGIPQVTAPTK